MAKLWIMLGEHEAAGWDALRKDYQDKKIEIIHLDARVWAIVEAEEPRLPELRQLTRSMNATVRRLRAVFDAQAEQVAAAGDRADATEGRIGGGHGSS